ncbi:MAG: ABC transporter ATP-binding protein [Chloroflexota bacterium]
MCALKLNHALELSNVSKSYTVVKQLTHVDQNNLLDLRKLTRFFLGETFSILGTRGTTSIQGLDNVSFTVEPGQVVGLFGKNGSGKTTLLSILGGIFPQDQGSVRCYGYDLASELYQVRKHVVPIFGWLNATTWSFTGRQNIEKFLIMHHVEPGPLSQQIEELAKELELYDRLDDRAARYSQGMRVKIQIIVAILLYRVHGYSLLLLDEPFLGLDFFTQRYLREFIKYQMQGENFTMLLATHQSSDIEEICDEVIVIDQGRIKAKDVVQKLRQSVRQTETIRVRYYTSEILINDTFTSKSNGTPNGTSYSTHNGSPLPGSLIQRNGILEQKILSRQGKHELTLTVTNSQETLSWLISDMVHAGCHLTSVETQPMNFEDVLVKLIEDE